MGWEDQLEERGDDVYKIQEVDFLLNDMYDNIMSEFEQRLTPNIKKDYYFNNHKTSFLPKKSILQKLYAYLISGGYIEEIEYRYFEKAFSGKVVESNFTSIKWSKQGNTYINGPENTYFEINGDTLISYTPTDFGNKTLINYYFKK